MTLPSFATLKVLVTVALLAAVAGISTQVQAQLSVYTDRLPDTDGLSDAVAAAVAAADAAKESACPPLSDSYTFAGFLADVTTFPGTPERMTVVNWGDWGPKISGTPGYGNSGMVIWWPVKSADYQKYADCVQRIRLKVEIWDTTDLIRGPICKPTVARSFTFETSERHGSEVFPPLEPYNYEYVMRLDSRSNSGPDPDLEVVYYGTDGSGTPSLDDIAPDDGGFDGGGLADTIDDAIGKRPCARGQSTVQIKARGWYLPKAAKQWLPIPFNHCTMRSWDVQTLPRMEPMYDQYAEDVDEVPC